MVQPVRQLAGPQPPRPAAAPRGGRSPAPCAPSGDRRVRRRLSDPQQPKWLCGRPTRRWPVSACCRPRKPQPGANQGTGEPGERSCARLHLPERNKAPATPGRWAGCALRCGLSRVPAASASALGRFADPQAGPSAKTPQGYHRRYRMSNEHLPHPAILNMVAVRPLSLPPATEGLSCAGQAQGRAKSGGRGLDLRPQAQGSPGQATGQPRPNGHPN